MNLTSTSSLILLQVASTWALVGLIWHVQLVQYPLFRDVGRDSFRHYHDLHMRRITWVVAPLMLVELVATVLAMIVAPDHTAPWILWSGVVLLGVVWLSTMLLQVPCHNALAAGFVPVHHERLVRTNWIRTMAWTGRGILLLIVLTELLP